MKINGIYFDLINEVIFIILFRELPCIVFSIYHRSLAGLLRNSVVALSLHEEDLSVLIDLV